MATGYEVGMYRDVTVIKEHLRTATETLAKIALELQRMNDRNEARDVLSMALDPDRPLGEQLIEIADRMPDA